MDQWAEEVSAERERSRRERDTATRVKRTVLPRTSGTGLDVFVTDGKEVV